MQFGKSYEEVKAEPAASGGGFLKYFKDGDTTFRIIQEPKDWVGYWEHFNPGGFSFPCTQDRKTCPGCTSSNDKMKKAGRKIAIQVLEGEYVNVYKFPKTVADKLDNRFQRIGTITDRDYTISRLKSGDKVEYDIEGQDKIPLDFSKLEYKDVEAMLQQAYEDAWGDNETARENQAKAAEADATAGLKGKLAGLSRQDTQAALNKEIKEEPAPFEQAPAGAQKEWTEAELRGLSKDQIIKVCVEEANKLPPGDLETTDQIVDWLLLAVGV